MGVECSRTAIVSNWYQYPSIGLVLASEVPSGSEVVPDSADLIDCPPLGQTLGVLGVTIGIVVMYFLRAGDHSFRMPK
jgi:hypothetical protein